MGRHVFSLALVLIFATAAFAGEPEVGQFNFTVGGGINMPNSDEADNGYIIGSGLGYHLTPQLVVGGEVSYLGYSKVEGTSLQGDYSLSQHFFEYGGAAKYFLGTGKAAPYFKGFAGRFNFGFDFNVGGLSAEESYSDMQFGGGIGMVVRGSKESNLYFEALYHSLQVEEDTAEVFTVTMGVDLNFRP